MTCPDPHALAAFARGQCPDAAQGELARHLESCAACRAALEEALGTTAASSSGAGARPEACPEREELAQYARGLMSGIRTEELARHVATCPRCRRTMDEALGETSPAPAPAGPAVRSGHARGSMVGRYVVLERLGEGGMGEVYAAWDPDLDRKVALKLLRGGADPSDRVARLLREAQVMAQLDHPNVVAIHDVGTADGESFLAMEVVDGGTLVDWLREKPRTRREIVEAFQAAGRGLAAAHARGIVHRDFKPQNVLVGRDGRVRVTDFGLARPGSAPQPPRDPLACPSSPSGELTQAGTILGTPAYMAPEQFAGQPADARSDQFSFCVALYEALYGERPFSASSFDELASAVSQERFAAAPRRAKVPARLRQLLLRGLSAAPDRRFESMDALLAALEADPARSRRRAAALLALPLAAALGVGGARLLAARQEAPCRGAPERFAAVWNPEVRAAAAKAFRATGAPFAAQAWATVEATLAGYGTAWSAMRTAACEATQVRREQSAQLMDLRMQCLDARLAEVGALGAVFAAADAPVVEKAVQAARSLSPLEPCADGAALLARVPPPASAEQRARVAALQEKVAGLKGAFDSGRWSPALSSAREVVDSCRAARWRPLEAQALYWTGRLEAASGEFGKAEADLSAAIQAAEAGRDDETAAQAWIALAFLAHQSRRPEQGAAWSAFAAAAVERVGSPDRLAAQLETVLGSLDRLGARFDAAIEHQERALSLNERSLGPDHPELGENLNGLGNAALQHGELERALAFHTRALELRQAALGPKHPAVAASLLNLGLVLEAMGHPEAALERMRAALAIFEAGVRPGHPDLATCLSGLGSVLCSLGMLEEAEASLQRALRMRVAAYGASSAPVATSLTNLGELRRAQGRPKEAREVLERALALRLEVLGPDHPQLATTHEDLCLALHDLSDDAAALPHCRRAVALAEGGLAPEAARLARALTSLGQVQLKAAPAAALEALERALALHRAHPRDSRAGAETAFALAQALAATRRDPDRAKSLAREARDVWALRAADKDRLSEVEAWLARR